MRRAMEIASDGMRSGEAQPFGCVIVRNGEIVGEGFNAVIKNHDATAYGEVEAMTGPHPLRGDPLLQAGQIIRLEPPAPRGPLHFDTRHQKWLCS